jgi:dinuclear metal center YbgI/SA1388 family protein
MINYELEKYIDTLLDAQKYQDMCPNGLQVEGRKEIKKIACGVSACVELFSEAIKEKADAVLVHHGIIWDFEKPLFRGGHKNRVKLLLENDINLFAYHLPLDGNMQFGNNALIARMLQGKDIMPFGEYKGSAIGCSASFNKLPSEQLFKRIKENINPEALIFPFGSDSVSKVGIISGAAQKQIKEAVLQGMDTFISGEVSEHVYHYAREEGIHFVAAGHHATEIFGVRELGRHLEEKFGLDVQFINIHNPV